MLHKTLGAAALLALNQASALKCEGSCLKAANKYDSPKMYGIMERKKLRWKAEMEAGLIGNTASSGPATCQDGFAGEYACSGIDLLSFVLLGDFNCKGNGNDIWGWTDDSGNEYVIAGCADASSLIDVTDPVNPVVLGYIPTQTVSSSWRDMKVYKGHVYIGSEAKNHGMQVFDLHQLSEASAAYRLRNSDKNRNVTELGHVNLGVKYEPTVVYTEFGSSHNIVINEASGFLYAVGTKTCAGGLHMVDIREPANPQFAGCYAEDGYTHDSECVIYSGPDTRYTGREICFNYNEDTLTIVDVTHKDEVHLLSRYGYQGSAYTHQGWLNPEQSHLMLDDELDEQEYAPLQGHTRTMIWDVSKLDEPKLTGNFYSEETAIDHNQYIHKGMSWQSNYCAGLRVLDANNLQSGSTKELGYFDCAPECDTADFSGTWSNYPYFESGTIAVQSIEKGLFLVKSTI
jgi:choice-of-anchor B domain-containing protein